jgi:hypothetical protein
MEENYQYCLNFDTGEISTEEIIRLPVHTWIPNNDLNRDWRRYQQWLLEDPSHIPLPPPGQ